MNFETYQKVTELCQTHNARLMIVTKNHPYESIEAFIEKGHTLFGENRVQETESKWEPILSEKQNLELHLIGPLQTNKVQNALELFDVIQTLDRPKLAIKIKECLEKSPARTTSFFIQVNTGEEPQKAGISKSEATDFITFCQQDLHLPIKGLMCIPPSEEDPAPHFSYLSRLAHHYHLPEVSMGMSNDYTIALENGATIVRIGSLIMGSRT